MVTISKSDRLKEFQCQFTEQLKCLENHMNIDNCILADLNEFYKKRAIVEQEYADSLNRLNQNFCQRLNNEQQRRQQWPKYSSLDLINTLIVANQRTSHSHSVMARIFGQQMTQRIIDVQDDVLRLHKQSRDLLQQCQQNIINTHIKLSKDYKTYVLCYNFAEDARKNLDKVKEKIDKEEKKYVSKNKDFLKSNKFKKLNDDYYEKNEFFKTKRLSCIQARNEYILQTAAANRTIEKFFSQEIHDVLECLSYGYHNNLSRAILNHINCEEGLITSHRTIVDILHATMNNIDARKDTGLFLDRCSTAFSRFSQYKYHPTKDDQIKSIVIDDTNRELVKTFTNDLENNVQFSLVEVEEIWKTIEESAKNLNSLISQKDYEVDDMFLRSHLTSSRTKEASISLNNSISSTTQHNSSVSTSEDNLYLNVRQTTREARIEQERFYIESLQRYLAKNQLYNYDHAKFEKLQAHLTDLNCCSASTSNTYIPLDSPQEELDVSFSVATTPSCTSKLTRQLTKKGHRRLGVKELQSKPRLFGGSLEDYCEKAQETIPQIVKTCVRVINQHGMQHQGIFRIPGSQTEMLEYRELFEKGDSSIVQRQFCSRDVNSIAGLMKLYFRELVDPIFPNSLFNRLIDVVKDTCQDNDDINVLLANIRAIVWDLSECTYGVVRFLFGFFNHLCEYSEDNMMDAGNLAICLGPCLMPLPNDLSQLQFEYQPYVNQVIRLLIDKYRDIFEYNDEICSRCVNCKYDRAYALELASNPSATTSQPNVSMDTNHPCNITCGSSHDLSIDETDNISEMSIDSHSLDSSSNNLLGDYNREDHEENTECNDCKNTTTNTGDSTTVHTITRCESNRYPVDSRIKHNNDTDDECVLKRPYLTRKLSDSDMKAMTYAVTISDYKAASAKELSFCRGQSVKLYRRLNQHWWEGCLNTSITPDKSLAIGLSNTSPATPFQIGLIPHSYLNIDNDSIGALKRFGQNRSTTSGLAVTPNISRKLVLIDFADQSDITAPISPPGINNNNTEDDLSSCTTTILEPPATTPAATTTTVVMTEAESSPVKSRSNTLPTSTSEIAHEEINSPPHNTSQHQLSDQQNNNRDNSKSDSSIVHFNRNSDKLQQDDSDSDYNIDETLAEMMQGFVNLEHQNTIRLKTQSRQRLEAETLALEMKFISPLSKHTPDLVRDAVVSVANQNQANQVSNQSDQSNCGESVRSNATKYTNKTSADLFAMQTEGTVRKRFVNIPDLNTTHSSSNNNATPSPTPKIAPPLAPKPKLSKGSI